MPDTLGSRGFHHVALAAADFDRSLEFYHDGLGFVPFRAWGGPGERAVMLAVGAESYLEIFERPDDPLDAGRLLHLALRVDDCRAAHAAAIEAGAREKMAPTEVEIPADPPFPVTISFVLGPDGEEIELFQER
tara:strand:+ start:226 stop:624 length:399 start_codon:yes stop_codon:yes gene_type:complete